MPTRHDEIRTDRLLMRRWSAADRAPFAAMNADPEVMRYFESTQDRRTSDAFVDRIEQRFEKQGFGLWAIELLDTGEFIGFTGLNPMPDGTPGAGGMEVGWRLARQAWHHGYATEAARAVLAVAFGPVGLDEIWSVTAVGNSASRAVMERLGMTMHSYFDHPSVSVGSPVRPHVAYRLQRAGSRYRPASRPRT
jgi:RimJ/RimL family protein N-acetyltransferase